MKSENLCTASCSLVLALAICHCRVAVSQSLDGTTEPVGSKPKCVVKVQRTCAGEFGTPPAERWCSQIVCTDTCEGEKGFNFIASPNDYVQKKFDSIRDPIPGERGELRVVGSIDHRCAYIWTCNPECRMVPGEGKRCFNSSSELTLGFKTLGKAEASCDPPADPPKPEPTTGVLP